VTSAPLNVETVALREEQVDHHLMNVHRRAQFYYAWANCHDIFIERSTEPRIHF
jgi:hypothetical protein